MRTDFYKIEEIVNRVRQELKITHEMGYIDRDYIISSRHMCDTPEEFEYNFREYLINNYSYDN